MSLQFPALKFPLPRRRGSGAYPVLAEDSHPYPAGTEDTIIDALNALPEEEPAAPSFTPADPADTGVIPALAFPQETVMREVRTSKDTQPQAMQPGRGTVTDTGVMARVLTGLRRLDRTSRIPAFDADRRELPFFGGMVREMGWHGLHMHADEGIPVHRAMAADRWYAAQMARIQHTTEMARAGLRAQATMYDGLESRRRAAADAAHQFGRVA